MENTQSDQLETIILGELQKRDDSDHAEAAKELRNTFHNFPSWQEDEQEALGLKTALSYDYCYLFNENPKTGNQFVDGLYEQIRKSLKIDLKVAVDEWAEE